MISFASAFAWLKNNPVLAALVLATLYGVGRLVEHYVTRLIDKRPQSEQISQLSQLADLREKLSKQGANLEDIKKLRDEIFNSKASKAIAFAEHYTAQAQIIVNSSIEAPPKRAGRARLSEATTQAEMNEEAFELAFFAERDLESLVARMQGPLDKTRQEALRRSQALWEEFREAESDRESQVAAGGSIQPLIKAMTKEALTRERIAALQADPFFDPERNWALVPRATTPFNLLDVVHPGVPSEKVLAALGSPSELHGSVRLYRYEDTQVQISLSDTDVVESVVIAACKGKKYLFKSDYIDKPLGELTIHDLQALDPNFSFTHRFSARTEELVGTMRFGPSGAWTDFFFGALKLCSDSGELITTSFTFDNEKNELTSNPSHTLINWIGLGTSEESMAFYWYIAP